MRMLIPLLMALSAGGQAPAPKPPAEAPAPRPEPAAASGYTYSAEGRRDPFVSLVGGPTDTKQPGAGAAGVPGLLVSEVAVKGIMRSPSGFIAMIQAGDGKTYVVHGGDRLQDGVIKSIARDQVVFSQEVDDRLARVRQREVVKRVRAVEGPEER